MNDLRIAFGCLSDPLEEQLKKQGYTDKKIEKHKLINDAIIRLFLHGYLTDSQTRKMRDKLFKEIKKNIKEI